MRFRFFTWVIIAVNVLFLVWIITGVAGRSDATCEGLDQQSCQAAADIGTGIGAMMIVFLWAATDVVLGVLWLITRPKTRDCPSCGRSVKRGATVCKGCGYDFALASGQATRGRQFPADPGVAH